MKTIRQLATAFLLIVSVPGAAAADWDLMIFGGRSYPTDDERLVIRLPDVPPFPGLEISQQGTPAFRGEGGPVFGGALASDGIIGVEFRLDLTDVNLQFSGIRYDLSFVPPVFGVSTGRVTIPETDLEVDRLKIISVNARVRTPGPLSVIASGGVSYLPRFEATGRIPIAFQLGNLAGVEQPALRMRIDPEESSNSFGVNGGAGIRMGGRVGLFAEARVFYFKSYELSFELENAAPPVTSLLERIDAVRFRPLVVNAIAGLSIRM